MAGKEEMRRNVSRGDGEAELILISVSVCPGQEQFKWGDVDGAAAQALKGSGSEALTALCDTSALGNNTGMGYNKEE